MEKIIKIYKIIHMITKILRYFVLQNMNTEKILLSFSKVHILLEEDACIKKIYINMFLNTVYINYFTIFINLYFNNKFHK